MRLRDPSLPNLLYLSPIEPAKTGNGLAMRAGIMLEALSVDYNICLLVVSFGLRKDSRSSSFVQSCCTDFKFVRSGPFANPITRLCLHPTAPLFLRKRITHPSEWKFISSAALKEANQAFANVEFDHIHVFRLYMISFASSYRQRQKSNQTWHLDLDDIESKTRQRFSLVYQEKGLFQETERMQIDAAYYERLEKKWLPKFDRVYICSKEDAEFIQKKYKGCRTAVIPNAVRIPASSRSLEPKSSVFRFLFIGNLNYYPNSDAIRFFTRSVLPILREKSRRKFTFTVVGAGKIPKDIILGDAPECSFPGRVNDIATAYDECDAIVAPVRAGGGTRIKILEAFSYQRPVVSTTIGMEGIAVGHGVHLLIADTPKCFANQCLRLMNDDGLVTQLSNAAYKVVTTSYDSESTQRRIRAQHTSRFALKG